MPAVSGDKEVHWKSVVDPLTDTLIEAFTNKGNVVAIYAKSKRKAPDSKCKTEAMEALHLLTACGAGDQVLARMMHTVKNHKTPKVVVAAIESCRLLLHDYGPTAINPRPIATEMENLLDHKDGQATPTPPVADCSALPNAHGISRIFRCRFVTKRLSSVLSFTGG